jgi:hypothetical protein
MDLLHSAMGATNFLNYKTYLSTGPNSWQRLSGYCAFKRLNLHVIHGPGLLLFSHSKVSEDLFYYVDKGKEG